jgi:hypothetical protein
MPTFCLKHIVLSTAERCCSLSLLSHCALSMAVESTAAHELEGPGFKYWLGDRIFVAFLSISNRQSTASNYTIVASLCFLFSSIFILTFDATFSDAITITTTTTTTTTNSVALVSERTVLTEQPQLVGEVSDNFCG